MAEDFSINQCVDRGELYTPADYSPSPSPSPTRGEGSIIIPSPLVGEGARRAGEGAIVSTLICDDGYCTNPAYPAVIAKSDSSVIARSEATKQSTAPVQDSYAEAGSVPFAGYWNYYTDESIPKIQRGVMGAFLPVMAPLTVAAGFLGAPFGCGGPSANPPDVTGEGESESEAESEGSDAGPGGRMDAAPDTGRKPDQGIIGPKPDAADPDGGVDAAPESDAGPDGGGPACSPPAVCTPDGGSDGGGDAGPDGTGGSTDGGVDGGVGEPDAGETPDSGPEDPDGGGAVIVDADGDGVAAELDCDDNDSTVYPGAPEVPYDGVIQDCNRTADLIDVDGDGVVAVAVGGTDCDDNNPTIYQPLTGFIDADGDGYTIGPARTFCSGAELAGGLSPISLGTDCNEADSLSYQNLTGYQDADGDGFTTGDAQTLCSGAALAAGFASTASTEVDCNDDQSYIHPGAAQLMNGIDTNCDGNLAIDLGRDATAVIGEKDTDRAGSRAIAIGDVNGDGFQDLIVGAVNWSTPGFNDTPGKVYIKFGGESVFSPGTVLGLADADVSLSGACSWGMGAQIVTKDLNGDGIADIIVGVPGYNSGQCDGFGDGDGSGTGALLIAYGRSTWAPSYDFYDVDTTNPETFSDSQMALIKGDTGEQLGVAIYSIGDINGDGTEELIVGGAQTQRCDAIPALPYEGIQPKADIIATHGGVHLHDWAGSAICANVASGDVDGDGREDFALGDNDDWIHSGAGNVTLIMGSRTLPADINFQSLSSAGLRYVHFYGNGAGYEAGGSVSIGDVDGDGHADLFIGVPWENDPLVHSGKVYFIPGSAVTDVVNGANPTFPNGYWIRLDGDVYTLGGGAIHGDVPNAEISALGISATSDTNNDGHKDLVIGSWFYGHSSEGKGFFFGNPAGAVTSGPSSEVSVETADHVLTGVPGSNFGGTVVGGGDLDGNGVQDVVINAPYAPGNTQKGISYVFLGGAAR